MSSNLPSVSTRTLTRDQLAEFIKNPRTLIAFNRMMSDVQTTLPDSIQSVADEIDELYGLVANNGATTVQALVLAISAMEGAYDGPPPVPQMIPDIPDDQTATIALLHARLAVLERAVAELTERPTP